MSTAVGWSGNIWKNNAVGRWTDQRIEVVGHGEMYGRAVVAGAGDNGVGEGFHHTALIRTRVDSLPDGRTADTNTSWSSPSRLWRGSSRNTCATSTGERPFSRVSFLNGAFWGPTGIDTYHKKWENSPKVSLAGNFLIGTWGKLVLVFGRHITVCDKQKIINLIY